MSPIPRIILTLLFFLGAIAATLFYLWPETKQYLAMRSDTGELRRISAELDSAAEARDNLRRKINAVSKEDLERVGLVLPKTSDRETLIRTVDYYAASSGVFVDSMRFDEDKAGNETNSSVPRPGGAPEAGDKGAIRRVGISIEASGNYANMKRFLDSLEKHVRILDVLTLEFAAMKSAADVFDFSLTANAYYQ